jgi:hypothetical protein
MVQFSVSDVHSTNRPYSDASVVFIEGKFIVQEQNAI